MTTTIHDLPDVILTNIMVMITDVRSRNSAALVNQKWLTVERQTRTRLTIRGNIMDLLYNLPTCYTNVTHLDLSLLSPWGVSLSSVTTTAGIDEPAVLLTHRLRLAFPRVTSLTFYSRSPSSLELVSQAFPFLSEIKLVRWHPRPQQIALGSDYTNLFENCRNLKSIDLSCFYCWTEDIPPAIESRPEVGRRLDRLNLLNLALPEGYKSDQILSITSLCPNLRDFRVGCVFDPGCLGFIGDEALVGIPGNCKRLRVVHLADISSREREFDEQGFSVEEAGFSMEGLVGFISGLGEIEELVLDVGKNVRESWVALEALGSKCPNLRVLELGCFHGICKAVESHLDGVALCHRLESLSIKHSADLNDSRLIEIGRGCCVLSKFEVSECRNVTMRGLRTMVCLLRETLVEVEVSGCRYLDASASLQAVEPICNRVRKLHIDCVWDGEKPYNVGVLVEQGGSSSSSSGSSAFNLNEAVETDDCEIEESRMRKRSRVSLDEDCLYSNGGCNGFAVRSWERLEFLSLWIGVGELLTPLADAGLEHCPNLSEIHIKVDGDCREGAKPPPTCFGINSLVRYPKLSKMKLDCRDTIGYALTAPSGHMDLSLWERWFLNYISDLGLNELDYWPPQDREVNQRSLSLPTVASISKCETLRKLFIHGTAHEHFMMFFIAIPNLRDVQLRGDYYPSPENDTSTEMRSCCRFEYKLNARQIPD